MQENNSCYIGKILKLIEKLQQTCECPEGFDNSCSRPFLGTPVNLECYNTRPVTFYGCNNNLITLDYTSDQGSGTSSIFRVERVDGCCCTVSLLIPNPDTTATNRPYITTDQNAIINLDCVCCLKCLPDTIVDL